METNRIEFTGTIGRLKSVNTKSGVSMATLLLKCVAFKNVADAILRCSDGDLVSVAGSGSINSWKDKEERWHNDFQLSVWEVEINDTCIKYEKILTSVRVQLWAWTSVNLAQMRTWPAFDTVAM